MRQMAVVTLWLWSFINERVHFCFHELSVSDHLSPSAEVFRIVAWKIGQEQSARLENAPHFGDALYDPCSQVVMDGGRAECRIKCRIRPGDRGEVRHATLERDLTLGTHVLTHADPRWRYIQPCHSESAPAQVNAVPSYSAAEIEYVSAFGQSVCPFNDCGIRRG